MKSSEGGHAVLSGLTIQQPTNAEGFLVAARHMLAGAQHLEHVPQLSPFAVTLLCGHSCESALKAVLAQSGTDAAKLSKRPYGHDLEKLWEFAAVHVSLPTPQPAWVEQLNRVFHRPFKLRYPLGFHGIVLPNTSEMVRGTELLASLAESFVK